MSGPTDADRAKAEALWQIAIENEMDYGIDTIAAALADARAEADQLRDVVVSVQDGNYQMAEVVRVTPPDEVGPVLSVSVTFGVGTSSWRPASVHVTYAAPAGAR